MRPRAEERTLSMFEEAPAPQPKQYMPFPPERAPHANEVEPKAPAARESTRGPDGVVVTRSIGGQYLIQRVRDNGTTFAGWFCTRAELEQLVEAATEALK